MLMWPAIIGAVGGIASGLINNGYSQANAAQSFQNQKELMRLQNQYSRQNWALENAYNTPKAQMERLRSAGLNPNLIYGNGASGLQSGSVSSPTAPSAPMAQTVPFENPMSSAVEAAQGIAAAKKVKSEGIARDIENQYLEKRLQNDLNQQLETLGLTQDQRKQIQAMIPNISKQGALLEEEANALRTRVGYEEIDRYIAAANAVTQRMATKNKIDDDTATRTARIFSLMAKGRMDDAQAYIVGLFKDPKKFKSFVTDWGQMLKDVWNELTKDGEDSEGHSTISPFNKNPKSKTAKAARSFFMAADDWMSEWLGTPQPWKK